MTTNIMPGFENGDNAAGVMPTKKDKRWRIQHRFWLDARSLRDIPIGEYLADMKKARRLTETIRDGVRLIRDLRSGRVEVLCELFPWIRDAFTPETPGDGMNALLQKIAADTEQLVAGASSQGNAGAETRPIGLTSEAEKLKYISVSDPPVPPQTPPIATPKLADNPVIVSSDTPTAPLSDVTPTPRPTGLKPIAGASRAIAGPLFDEDDTLLLAVRPDENAGKQAAMNFIASTLAMCKT